MKKLLLTGGTGFIGKNVIPILKEYYEVYSPSRQELNLKDEYEVRKYLVRQKFDAIIHCANPNPAKNPLDQDKSMLVDSLRIFMNLYGTWKHCGKIIYLGSGAEYDKTREICSVNEPDCFRSIPKDVYGFSKYIMNCLASVSENVYNVCLFACYGPGDHQSKFITHCIRCCLRNEPITIRQDCRFDYYHVYDLATMMIWLIENQPKYNMYNACSGSSVLLSEIAREVNKQMGSQHPIIILKSDFNLEYTASNERFVSESGIRPTVSLADGISMQIKWERENWIIDNKLKNGGPSIKS